MASKHYKCSLGMIVAFLAGMVCGALLIIWQQADQPEGRCDFARNESVAFCSGEMTPWVFNREKTKLQRESLRCESLLSQRPKNGYEDFGKSVNAQLCEKIKDPRKRWEFTGIDGDYRIYSKKR